MIRNLRLLRRGLEADVEIGSDKHGRTTWVHVELPLDDVCEELAPITAKFAKCASDLVQQAAVDKAVRKEVDALRNDVIKHEKERLQRDAKAEAARLASDLRRELDGSRRENLRVVNESDRLRHELSQLQSSISVLQRLQTPVTQSATPPAAATDG